MDLEGHLGYSLIQLITNMEIQISLLYTHIVDLLSWIRLAQLDTLLFFVKRNNGWKRFQKKKNHKHSEAFCLEFKINPSNVLHLIYQSNLHKDKQEKIWVFWYYAELWILDIFTSEQLVTLLILPPIVCG